MRTLCKTCAWADSLVPVYPCKWGQGERQGSKKLWPAYMNVSWLCKSLWLLIRMRYQLGKVPGKQCAVSTLLRNTCAGAALKLTASSLGSTRCSHIHTRACLLLPLLPLLAAGTGLAPAPRLPGQSPTASGDAPASSIRLCLSQKPSSPACTPLHAIIREKNCSALTSGCSFAEVFGSLQLSYKQDFSSFSTSINRSVLSQFGAPV